MRSIGIGNQNGAAAGCVHGQVTCGADLRYVLSKPSLLVRSLVSMNVLAPIVTLMLFKMFSLYPAVIVALVTLAVAP